MSMLKPTTPPPTTSKAVRPFHEVATDAQLEAHADALRGLATKFAKVHNKATPEAKAAPSNNGFDADTTGTVDWAKQDGIKTGPINVQAVSQTHAKAGR